MAEPRRTPPAAEVAGRKECQSSPGELFDLPEGMPEVNVPAVLNGTPSALAVHELARSQKHECRVQFGTATVRDSQ